jgi:hypothetical protein
MAQDTSVAEAPFTPDVPPETAFWKKYNEHFEGPISAAVSIFVHVAIFAGLIFFTVFILKREKPAVPIMMIDGFDDSGVGSPGSGGEPEPVAKGFSPPTADDIARLNLPQPLPEIKNKLIQDYNLDSTDASIKIPDDQAAAYASLDKALQDKFLGQQKGDGNSDGRGSTGQVGKGPGGFGADSTRARSMRWVMRFNVQDGRDYLRQLTLLKATILVPIPPQNKDMRIFRGNLLEGKPNRLATDSEIDELKRQMRFCDITAKAVAEVAAAFKLDFTPQSFFAFFPKDLEEKLARMEENYKGRKAKDIEETKFEVRIRGDQYEFIIIDQILRK